MNFIKDTLPKSDVILPKGRWGKYTGIALIAISIIGLIITPTPMRWLILMEGAIGIIGIVVFVYSRIKFWQEVNKLIK